MTSRILGDGLNKYAFLKALSEIDKGRFVPETARAGRRHTLFAAVKIMSENVLAQLGSKAIFGGVNPEKLKYARFMANKALESKDKDQVLLGNIVNHGLDGIDDEVFDAACLYQDSSIVFNPYRNGLEEYTDQEFFDLVKFTEKLPEMTIGGDQDNNCRALLVYQVYLLRSFASGIKYFILPCISFLSIVA